MSAAWATEALELGDWTGRVLPIEVRADRLAWRRAGDTFHLELVQLEADTAEDPRWRYQGYRIRGDAWAPDHQLGTVGRIGPAGAWSAIAPGISRDGAEAWTAAARLVAVLV